MQLSPIQKQIGKDNFNEAVGFTRRSLLKGAAGGAAGLGSLYFGYGELKGKPVRVGVIGTGDEGGVLLTQHPPEYMDIVAVADIRPSNLKRAFLGDGNEHRIGLNKKLGEAKASQIKQYPSHKELIADPNVEAVVIAVPLVQHAPIALEAMDAGKHVLTEKLMAWTVTQCKEMIKVAREKKLLLAVGHQRHYSVLYDNANDLVQRGILGDIKHIRAQWHRNNSFPKRDGWRKDMGSPGKAYNADKAAMGEKAADFGYGDYDHLANWRLYNNGTTSGGLMSELGSHQMDAASIFLGKVHPLAVQGYGGRNFYGVKGVGSPDKQEDQREIDDHVYLIYEFPGPHYDEDKNDIVIVTYSSLNTNRLEPYGETVFGSRGTLMVHLEQDVMLFKEASPTTGSGGLEQRLHVIQGNDGGPALNASESLAPSTQAAVAGGTMQKVSRGYTEEMAHFCYCVRNEMFEVPPDKGGLRCNGVVAMGDAIMAFGANLAMKHQKRVVFKHEWFDPDNPAVPETDPDVIG